MEIIFFELTGDEINYFKNHLIHDQITYYTQPLTESNTITGNPEIVSIALRSQVTEKTLDQFPALKLIITRSTGVDHIDLNATRRRNILISSSPLYASESVAEHTFALLLMLSKKMKQSCCSLSIYLEPLEAIEGFELANKTLGIIGFGNIGKAVARIAQGFEMKIIVHDDFQKNKADGSFNFVDLTTLYAQADILSFHIPLTQDTRHFFNKKTLSLLKKGVFVLNTARGEIIETEALIDGLEQGIIAGAGLDVLEEEHALQTFAEYNNQNLPNATSKLLVQNILLLQHPRVIVTRHNAFNTKEATQRLLENTCAQIEAYKKGTLHHSK